MSNPPKYTYTVRDTTLPAADDSEGGNKTRVGVVYLVGAGPGDRKLITYRALEVLGQANVVIYDRLVHPSLLDLAPPDAERIYVGKSSAQHVLKQYEINALLVYWAGQGKSVVRLKGGDPFVFGRGGEEAEVCREAGIPFEIVPGITSAIAAPAYAGIPVTHRDAASSFAVITGHERDDAGEAGTRAPGAAEGRRNWQHIAHAADTLIFLMGVEALPEITARLQEHGRSPETPVALVQWGTWVQQRVVVGTLSTIVEEVRAANLTPPAVCVVGEVVKLRESLHWFEEQTSQPLLGKRILVTRAREQASTLSGLLWHAGADPVEFPVVKIVPTETLEVLDAALSQLKHYAWMLLTSANAVPVLAERLEALKLDARAFANTKIAVIGASTADALWEQLRLRADFIPSEAVSEALIREWPDPDLPGKRVLFPHAAEGRELIHTWLVEWGVEVDAIIAYRTVLESSDTESMREQLRKGELDAITFAASSAVKNFANALTQGDAGQLQALVGDTKIAVIGPITADTVRAYGLTPHAVAAEHTIPGLVAALETLFGIFAP
ncbi:MAG TPA: uroporphyrinogen-III C-methyltransferase [Chthonomonadaceae bacterium]|nr:uroporphyrinogen-III C-methyltransferase [Chthonomonadaceae bacterium]